ncbi:MAG: hypothetical protein KF812_06565 [Fimbriimonadaceae bacterium]|nr:hypothetical protein [Fimbriimonadaceae bacterium]
MHEAGDQPPTTHRPPDEIDLRSLGRTLLRYWYLPVACGLFLGLIAAIVTFLVQPVYQARAALYIPVADRAVRLPSVVNAAPSDPVNILSGVLNSTTAQAGVREKLNLEPEDVSKHLFVEPHPYESQVILKFDWKDPVVAKESLDEMIAGLRKIDAEVGISLITAQLKANQEELDRVKGELSNAERDLSEFLATTQTNPTGTSLTTGSPASTQLSLLNTDLQGVERQIDALRQYSSAATTGPINIPRGIPSIDALQAKLAEAQLKLSTASSVFQPNTPEVKHARDEVEAVRKELAKEINNHNQSIRSNVNPDLVELQTRREVLRKQISLLQKQADLAPKEALEAQRLIRVMQVHETNYRALEQTVFDLSLQEKANEVKWTVLDPPMAGKKPVNKRYTLNVGIFGLLGGMLGLLWASRRS